MLDYDLIRKLTRHINGFANENKISGVDLATMLFSIGSLIYINSGIEDDSIRDLFSESCEEIISMKEEMCKK